MPNPTLTKKPKITLSDYSFHKDIECRLLMAKLSLFDTAVLSSILEGSLTIAVKELEENFEGGDVHAALKMLAPFGLFKMEGQTLQVDKEMRKCLESQIVKFNSDYTCGIEYIKTLLRKVPFDLLPAWYSLPRTSDEIFGAIVEKYLITPKAFKRHIEEASLEIPLLTCLLEDLEQSPGFECPSSLLCQKYQLSKEAFEELMLLLEFHFICCIGYREKEGHWEEIVTYFAEWKEYLHFLHTTKSMQKPKLETKAPFEFVKKLTHLLKQAAKAAIPLHLFEEKMAKILLDLQVMELRGKELHLLKDAELFLSLSDEKKAHLIYRIQNTESDRSVREVEKSVRKVCKEGWVFFDDFIKGCTACVGLISEISLKKVGKKWTYTLPSYTEEDIALIKRIIFEKFFEAGFVHTEKVDGRDCFSVTAFGRIMLE